MDSTLIATEVIDELALLAGVGEQVAKITEAAMRGKLDFQASFRERVALLRGLPESALQTVIDRLPLMEGAERLISTLRRLGYDAGLLSLAALNGATNVELIEHCHTVGKTIPLIGFYLQPAVGGRPLNAEFWERFVEIESVVAIKVASFDRYQTMEVLRAVAHSGRGGEIALYTGNDDNIVADLLTEFRFGDRTAHFVGGLLGQWAVWTSCAVELLRSVQDAKRNCARIDTVLARGAEITDANAAIFDARHEFHGCISGIHEVLRRQGLLAGRWCLDPHESLSAGQIDEINRIYAAYPLLNDDAFVAENLDRWLS